MEQRFKLNYAPHIGLTRPDEGMFTEHAGLDPVDQIKFIADQGFTAIEDNFLKMRPVQVQEQIGNELARCGLQMGCFVNNLVYQEPTFVLNEPEARELLVKQVKETIEVAKRVNGKWVTTLSGPGDPRLKHDYQTVNMIENLKRCAELCEQAGLIMLIEAINGIDFPGTFVTKVSHAYQIVRAVNSPSCKLVFDIYHVQIEDGDVIRNIDRTWNEIAYFHIADNPGRLEPTTGEINFSNILRHIHAKGYIGILDMEHYNSKPGKEGERTVIDTYVALDNF